MRNWFDTGCDCSNPEPIVGAIVGGKKFPFGTVKQSDYNADMEEVNNNIASINSTIVSLTAKHNSDVTLINHKIDDINEKIAAVNASMASVNSTVNTLSASVSAIDKKYGDDISAIKASITAINANLKSITETTDNLNARVTALENPTPTPPTPVTKYYVYWGTSSATTATSQLINSLQYNAYTDTTSRTISVTLDNEYCYYCIPADKGTVNFTVSGFTGGFNSPETVSVTLSDGTTKSYKAYRSTQKLNGTVSIVVKGE